MRSIQVKAMTSRWLAAGMVATLAAVAPGAIAQDAPAVSEAADFLLLDQAGNAHQLSRYCADSQAIVIGVYGSRSEAGADMAQAMNALHGQFADKGVIFLLLDPNKRESRERVMKSLDGAGTTLPVLIDESQLVARRLGFAHNGEVILVEPGDCSIAYRGGVEGLEAAITAYLAGASIDAEASMPDDAIKYAAMPADVSYTKDIVPIIESKCVACHSPGNIGPFSFSSHRRVQTWGPMIEEVVMTQRMPPWHADKHVGEFANARELSVKEKRALISWIENGAKKDGEDDPLEAVDDSEAPTWAMGEPDMIVELPEEQVIPATGVFDYRYFRIPSGLTEDKWVKAVDVQTTNRQVTHHVLVFLQYPEEFEGEKQDSDGGLEGFFAGYVPGFDPQRYPEDSGKFVPAGSEFVFQNHYTATGKEEHEITRLALYFHDTPPAREFVTHAAANVDFEILPGDNNSTTTAEYTIERDATLHKLIPHMHLRGSWFKYEAEFPNGKREELLSVPAYDFNWQHVYELKKPLKVPAGTIIHASGGFDNSRRNPNNPDPSTPVYFGDQTFDEMFIGYLDYSYDPDSQVEVDEIEDAPVESIRTGIPYTAENLIGTVWLSGKYRFTFNEDGKLRVNKNIRGKWWVENDRVMMKVLGSTYDLIISGDQLTYDDGEAVPRVQ